MLPLPSKHPPIPDGGPHPGPLEATADRQDGAWIDTIDVLIAAGFAAISVLAMFAVLS